MLKHGSVNPLNVHGLRRVETLPPHFHVVSFDLKTNAKNITDWINVNLDGRFWMGEYFSALDTGHVAMRKAVAFEVHEESTYFLMFLDEINKADF